MKTIHPYDIKVRKTCETLMRQGFGGDRNIRPLRVWVEEVEE